MWIPSLAWGQQMCAGFVEWLRTTGYASGWGATLLGRDDAFQGNQEKGLTKQQERTLKKASTNSKKASLEQKTQYKVVAGDNQAESLISSVKLQLRRSNRVGRGSPKLAHVDQLAALRMLNAPGLSNLLTAVANYRKARCNQMGCSPKDFFNLDTDENGCGSSVCENIAGVRQKRHCVSFPMGEASMRARVYNQSARCFALPLLWSKQLHSLWPKVFLASSGRGSKGRESNCQP